MGNLNYIVFGGVDSRDYGIYISGEGVFNAPERDVEVVNIPGKDGDLLIDRGRFLNIQVTYPGFNFEPDLSTFAERLRAFRAALASQTGYQRLEDSFHPDEFRLASFRSGLDVNPIMYNTASTFDIVFDCKPQRFLKSGGEEITIGEWGETQTVSGSVATFEAESNTGIKSLVVDIEPKQSGTGDPSPTNVRPISGWDSIVVSHSGEDTTSPQTITKALGRTVYGGTLDLISGVLTVEYKYRQITSFSGAFGAVNNGYCVYFADTETTNRQALINASAMKSNMFTYYGGVRTSAPLYSYGGDNGGATTQVFILPSEITSAAEANTWLANLSEPLYATFKLATPQTYQLTSEQIETILGVNNIWADSGEVSVEIGEDPNILVNPTPFEALPLFEVVGTGSLTVGNTTIGITGDSTQDIFIDSDIMEAYEDDNGAIISRNDRINLSGTDFPKLGEETRVESNGLTSVKITPRWWTI